MIPIEKLLEIAKAALDYGFDAMIGNTEMAKFTSENVTVNYFYGNSVEMKVGDFRGNYDEVNAKVTEINNGVSIMKTLKDSIIDEVQE